MGLYNKHILPKLVDIACRQTTPMRQRQKVVPLADGNILEIGIGTGLNLPVYDPDKVNHIWGLDPSTTYQSQIEEQVDALGFSFDFLAESAENIPLDSNSADTIVMTYTLCTIPDPLLALAEMRRVLKPTGQLVFCEHGAAPAAEVLKWQNRINPVWKRIGGGCNLNRHIFDLLKEGGFDIDDEAEAKFIPGWRPASFNYWGIAKKG